MSETQIPRRNPWKWIIPGGCLAVVLVCGGCLAAPFYALYAGLTSSDCYQQALQEMNNSQELTDALGKPVESSSGWRFWQIQGHININNDAGDADMAFPVKGPQGTGSAQVVARRAQGTWSIETLTVDVTGDGRITIVPHSEKTDMEPAE